MTASLCSRCHEPLMGSGLTGFCPRCTGRLLLDTAAADGVDTARAHSIVLRLGEYELGPELGRGAMGVVYRARQPRLRRDVAVKVILASRFAGGAARKRFLAEAELTAQLDHPNIVPIYEVGETPDGPFYAMKLVEGGTLASVAASRESAGIQTSVGSAALCRGAATMISKIARAVHHAHQRGVLHRDLKPGNILIDVAGEPHITDFGLARQLGADSSLTLSGAPLGTPAYMSPEQARGEKGISTASDVWSLGAILFHLLTGRPPFTGPTATDVLLHVRTQEAPRLRSLNPRLPSDLETICLKCLEKDPPRRYRDAAALADDLERFLGHEPILARPATRWERAAKWVRRHPARAALIALSVLAPVVVLALVLRYNQSLQEKNDQLAATLLRQDWQRAEELIAERKFAGGVALFARLLRDHPDNRSVAERLLSALARGSFAVRAGPQFEVSGDGGCNWVAFSRDGKRVIGGNENGLSHWDAGTGQQLGGATNAIRHPLADSKFWPSPDGRTVVMRHVHVTPPRLEVWDVPEARRLAEWQSATGITSAVFTAGGGMVQLSSAGGVEQRDVQFGRLPQLESTGLYADVAGASPWRADSATLVSLTLSNVLTGEMWREAVRHARATQVSAFSADGRRLVTAASDRTAQVWDLRPTRFAPTTLRPGLEPVRAMFSPDGRFVLTMSATNGAGIWEVATGRRRFEIPHGQQLFDANFDPTGRRVITAGNDACARVWDVETGREILPPLRHDHTNAPPGFEKIYDARFSRDGQRIVTTGADQEIRLWDAADHRLLVPPHQLAAPAHCSVFSPDGARLLVAGLRDSRLLEAHTLSLVSLLTTNHEWVNEVEFSRNSRWAIVVNGESADLFEPATGRHLGKFQPRDGGVHSARFSHDGRWLVTTSEGNLVRLWEVATGRLAGAPMQHGGRVYSADFSPDDRRIVTASKDGTARVWDSRTGLPLGEPLVHPAEVRGAGFSPDGRWVLTSCADGAARIWETPVINGPVPTWLAEFAEAIAGFRLDTTRSVELVFATELDRLRRQIESLPVEDECAKWARWVLDDRPNKPGSPSAPNRTVSNSGAQ